MAGSTTEAAVRATSARVRISGFAASCSSGLSAVKSLIMLNIKYSSKEHIENIAGVDRPAVQPLAIDRIGRRELMVKDEAKCNGTDVVNERLKDCQENA